MMMPKVKCPQCRQEQYMNDVVTAQSNQNIIYQCPHCGFQKRNIQTHKG
ncbi:hypothetical protein WAK64_02590 [Bacillus spongiae]|uniref:TFIIS-type domain-containing protein n=1 Tax=Bacillus spongiae TaxID=2683610 RepID=A0ABU8H9H6_9BACI